MNKVLLIVLCLFNILLPATISSATTGAGAVSAVEHRAIDVTVVLNYLTTANPDKTIGSVTLKVNIPNLTDAFPLMNDIKTYVSQHTSLHEGSIDSSSLIGLKDTWRLKLNLEFKHFTKTDQSAFSTIERCSRLADTLKIYLQEFFNKFATANTQEERDSLVKRYLKAPPPSRSASPQTFDAVDYEVPSLSLASHY